MFVAADERPNASTESFHVSGCGSTDLIKLHKAPLLVEC